MHLGNGRLLSEERMCLTTENFGAHHRVSFRTAASYAEPT